MVRSSKSSAEHRAVRADAAPGSRFARRSPSNSRLESVRSSRRREESGPPTKPSIAPRAAAKLHRDTPATPAEAFGGWQRSGRTLTYKVVLALAGLGLGLAGLALAASGRAGALGGSLWGVALGLVLLSLAAVFFLARSFALRLEALAVEAQHKARVSPEPSSADESSDPLMLIGLSIGKMSDRIEALTREIEQRGEEERGRVDALVRERTRQLGEEISDLRRLLGPTKAFLSIDAQGNIVGQSSSVIEGWLGPLPDNGQFWDYFDRVGALGASRFEAAWRDMLRGVPSEIDLRRMPKSVTIGDRYLALEYQAVQAPDGKLERLLVLLSDMTAAASDLSTTV